LNAALYNIDRITEIEKRIAEEGVEATTLSKQEKLWGGVKEFRFLDSNSVPTRWGPERFKNEAKKLRRVHGSKWKDEFAKQHGGYENWNELMENNGYITGKQQDKEFRSEGLSALRTFIDDNNISTQGKTYAKGGGIVTSESRTKGKEPHRIYGALDIAAAALGNKQKQDEFIQYMLNLGYRVIDEREAWSKRDGEGVGAGAEYGKKIRGVLHFDKRPFKEGEQYWIERTVKDGIVYKPHTKYDPIG